MYRQTPPPPPARRGRGVILVVVTAAVTAMILLALIVVVIAVSSAKTVSLGGRVVLVDTDPTSAKFTWDENPETCTGAGKYEDLGDGSQVVISDASGKTLAAGSLKGGIPGGFRDDLAGRIATTCTFHTSAPKVAQQDLYRVQVGQRPAVTVSDVQNLNLRFGG